MTSPWNPNHGADAGALPPWRVQAIFNGLQWFFRDVRDGTPEGNRIIGEEIFPAGGNPADVGYRNGKTAWCGRFVEACLRPVGLERWDSLDSVGRCLSFGTYNKSYRMDGTRQWTAIGDEHGLVPMKLQEAHGMLGDERKCWSWSDPERPLPLPGDIVLHQRERGSWHGHVMMAASVDSEEGILAIVEGNHSKTVGPTGEIRDGVGLRRLSLDDGYLSWLVRPSEFDFFGGPRFATEAAAEGFILGSREEG